MPGFEKITNLSYAVDFFFSCFVINRLPGRVETRHKKRAYVIWAVLVGALVAYTIWVITEAVKKRDDPSVNLTLEVTKLFTCRQRKRLGVLLATRQK